MLTVVVVKGWRLARLRQAEKDDDTAKGPDDAVAWTKISMPKRPKGLLVNLNLSLTSRRDWLMNHFVQITTRCARSSARIERRTTNP